MLCFISYVDAVIFAAFYYGISRMFLLFVLTLYNVALCCESCEYVKKNKADMFFMKYK